MLELLGGKIVRQTSCAGVGLVARYSKPMQWVLDKRPVTTFAQSLKAKLMVAIIEVRS
jgi:hypothetical protein